MYSAKAFMEQAKTKPGLILFDIYNTLLDMTEMERKINHLFASKYGYRIWFELFMQYCFVENCTVQFNGFTAIAKATMQMTSKLFGKTIDDDDLDNILKSLHHLPLHEGVQQGLSDLRNQGFRIAALTNSPEKTVRHRMDNTGLISYFEAVLSAEQVKKYKPCIAVYEWAAGQLGLDLQHILLVSSHSWDIAGAAGAGMQTCYITRRRSMLYPLSLQPTMVCQTIVDLAYQIKKDEISTGNPG